VTKVLEEHLKTAGKNAMYVSKTRQNELITLCGKRVADINQFWTRYSQSVLADETTDVSHHEQLCACVHNVKEENRIRTLKE
jgi:hypothetical protein